MLTALLILPCSPYFVNRKYAPCIISSQYLSSLPPCYITLFSPLIIRLSISDNLSYNIDLLQRLFFCHTTKQIF